MGTVQGKLIDTQKIREEREKELMIQREKMSENVRKLVRERTDLMNIKGLNKNSISMCNININSNRNHNYNYNTNLTHKHSAINIGNVNMNESSTNLNNYHKNINNENKKFVHSQSFSVNDNNTKYNDILNMWTYPNKNSISHSNDSLTCSNDITSNNEINNKNNNNSNIYNENFLNSQRKKKEFCHINNRNVRLQSLNINKNNNNNSNNNNNNNNNINNNSNNNNINNNINDNQTNDNKNINSENNIYHNSIIRSESDSYPYNERLYIKPYICEKQYRRGLDRYSNPNLSSLNKIRNRNRNIKVDSSLFNGNPCIPESLKLRLEREKSKDSLNKIYFNNPNDIFKKNSALIDAIEAEKKLNKNIEENLNKSNDPLFSVEDDDTLVEHDIITNNQNEKYRKTFDKEKFKKANNRYF
ncbi:hypothetical protein BCR32DRAFT_330322 [Anaeromyces robustus]|uniref:Uncharacterized protein n=1 Tax=Anaeromyces robustus TaxID=1754192 RepID=A0A1Y1VX27_9FUNG|nr:hypothetical protein BCR32DRAFT_330322 [Anaeromyces robustus]|eukprot:ORX65763.1 hypothetical protein BCR32DRAFT_330322 [Anaeromyces robustus]